MACTFAPYLALVSVGMAYEDRYGNDPVGAFRDERRRPTARRKVAAVPGLFVEHAGTEFYGEVVRLPQAGNLTVRDLDGLTRSFPISDSFLVDDELVTLVSPSQPATRVITASGSVMGERRRAQVARESRIFVEGRHDAELIEKVWGDDLREQAVVVELLDGIDHLEEVLVGFAPDERRRAGVLVDHLVDRSKEWRIARQVESRFGEHVLVLGHPYVDVWQAVKPERVGISSWPAPSRSIEWKRGVCQALGWPHHEQEDIARAWQFILSRVTTYRDLEPALSGQVEHLIDFVTVGHH